MSKDTDRAPCQGCARALRAAAGYVQGCGMGAGSDRYSLPVAAAIAGGCPHYRPTARETPLRGARERGA